MVAGGGCVDFLFLAYGGKAFVRLLTHEHKGLLPWRLSAPQGLLFDIPKELLYEIMAVLPVGSFGCCLNVSRTINHALEKEFMWKRLSVSSWPCAAPAAESTWRDFVQCGGGASLGKALLEDLKRMAEKRLKCPSGHELHRFRLKSGFFCCDLCGSEQRIGPEHGSESAVAWGCRECNYDHCDMCVKGNVMEYAHGAPNAISDEGWTSLHYACRHGLTDVVASLLDSRADVEVKDFLHGFTPLMVSATHGHPDVCSLLLARGAAKSTCNKFNKTAHAYASAWSQVDVLAMLAP